MEQASLTLDTNRDPLVGLAFILAYVPGRPVADRVGRLRCRFRQRQPYCVGHAGCGGRPPPPPRVVRCQRLFWDVIAVSMTLWVVGHLGWVYAQPLRDEQSWLKWHTLFSLCAGIGPLIALLTRPHRGPRAGLVAPAAMTIGAYGLLAAFSIPTSSSCRASSRRCGPRRRHAGWIRSIQQAPPLRRHGHRGVVRAGDPLAPTYLRMAVGSGLDSCWASTPTMPLRGSVSGRPLSRFRLDRAVALLRVGRRRSARLAAAGTTHRRSDETLSVTLLVVPALLIPLIGYGVLNLGLPALRSIR